MQQPFADKLRKIAPYVPGAQPKQADILKLNANENPYPPSPAVARALRGIDVNGLARYPDANSSVLKQAVSKRYGLSEGQVFVGNGSDDVLALAFQAFFCSKTPIVFPDITYSFYPVWCDLFRVPYKTLPLRADFTVDPRGFDAANGGVLLPNPNAPTGIALPLAAIEDILQHNEDAVVIVDEAYVDFGAESAVSLLPHYDNLLVVQTASKSRSLAGLRVGWCFGSPILIETLEAVKNSYNSYTLDTIAMQAAAAAISDEAYFKTTCGKVIDTRVRVTAALQQLGFAVLPSKTNFVFATHKIRPAKEIFDGLCDRGIYVRHFALPRIDNYLRITIGTEPQMQRLLSALSEML